MTIKALGELIERTTGLALDRGGVSGTLGRFVTERMHELKLTRVDDYIALAANPKGPEHQRLINAITVPHTWFYRDQEQLQVIAKLLVDAPAGRVEIWAAGCASGEEAYTLAMLGRSVGRDVFVYATDINETALETARRGVYSALAVRDVPEFDRRWLAQEGNRFVVDPVLKSEVEFVRHNLVDLPPSPPTRGGWDLVVCRNVLIYFAQPTVARMLERFARTLREGGSLVVGASEVVFEPPGGLDLISLGNRLVLRKPLYPVNEGRPPRNVSTVPVASPLGIPGFPAARMTPPMGLPTFATPPGRPAPSPGRTAPTPPTPITLPPTPIAAFAPPATAASASTTNRSAPNGSSAPGRDGDLIAGLTRGHALFERGDVAAAIPVYEELSRRHAASAEPWLFLGIARYAHGDVDEAARALRSSLCLAPSLWPADFYLARAYERLGRGADALHHYNLVSANEQKPLELQSVSAVINELRAFRHDFRTAARRVAAERSLPPRRPNK